MDYADVYDKTKFIRLDGHLLSDFLTECGMQNASLTESSYNSCGSDRVNVASCHSFTDIRPFIVAGIFRSSRKFFCHAAFQNGKQQRRSFASLQAGQISTSPARQLRAVAQVRLLRQVVRQHRQGQSAERLAHAVRC